MVLGPITSGILSDITNLHNDASDIKAFHEELKHGSKKHNGRKVSYSPRFARQHFKKTSKSARYPSARKPRKIRGIPGKQVTSKLKPPAQAGKRRPSSPLPKEPPRAMLELKRQNEARAAGPAGLSPSDKLGKNDLFNDLMGICKEIKTPKVAIEFKQTLNERFGKGLDRQEVRRLQSMLVYKLKQMATNPKVSDQLTSKLLRTLVGPSSAEDILKIKDAAEIDELQRRLDDLRRG
ncbi:hypothetical protein [Spongorhabdus nitratireducens]